MNACKKRFTNVVLLLRDIPGGNRKGGKNLLKMAKISSCPLGLLGLLVMDIDEVICKFAPMKTIFIF